VGMFSVEGRKARKLGDSMHTPKAMDGAARIALLESEIEH